MPLNSGSNTERGLDALGQQMIEATSLPMLLRFADRNSMAHGIEARLPYLDYRIVEQAVMLGDHLKIHEGVGKWILRNTFANVLPREVNSRRDKIGFATPEEIWMRGPLKKSALAGVAKACELFPVFLNRETADREAKEMLNSERPYDSMVWRLWCLALTAEVLGVTP